MKLKLIILLGCISWLLAARAAHGDPVVLEDFKLVGNLANPEIATFTLTANARVKDPHGGVLDVLSGPVALTSFGAPAKWHMLAHENHYLLAFEHSGVYPIAITFNAAVHQQDDWNSVNFQIASGTLQPIVLQGLAADTRFNFPDAARPERSGTNFLSYLPVDGALNFSWKQARPEAEGKLFYAAEMAAQISISPGLMSQAALLTGKVMQGEMNRLSLLLHGPGEVTRVQGDEVLAWSVEPVTNSTDRRLVVQFNQPQKDQFALQVQLQSPLDAFPQTADVPQIKPEGATRFAGYYRIVNDGAVRLEVVQAGGLSQLSPDQFPETDVTRALFRAAGSQRFVFRFSSADFALRIQAEQILPEVSVSQVLAYHYGENELAVDDDLELDIREAPLRELLLSVPKGYAVAKLSAAGLSDYFLSEPPGQDHAELRLVYGQPSLGRQVVQLRLERNQALGETNWNLPRLAVEQAKSVRGFVGVSADAGFRLNSDRTEALTEIATAFFPEAVPGLQAAFRLSDPAWSATVRVERLPQTMQADVLHLFSIGEGIAYGSSVINYVVSGAPVSAFRVDLSDEYYNVEFTGRDIRGWEKTTNGWLVQLNSPLAGSYTLLATFERPFKPQGETLSFSGARPLDAQSEQGHTIISSAYQFQVKPVTVSPGLLSLEPGEVPPDYRLFFDAPVLAAYQYSARPFDLKLALSPLAQGDSLNQVVDRASLTTHISKEGQVVTDIRYYLKNRGNPNLRVTLAPGTQLWSVSVNNTAVVPVMDNAASLIPLPPHLAPDAVLTVDLKVAGTNATATGVVAVSAPVLSAPILLAGWSLEPDAGRRLQYLQGSLLPVGGLPDISGFTGLVRLFTGDDQSAALTELFAGLGFVFLALLVWVWTARSARHRFSIRHVAGSLVGLLALWIAVIQFLHLGALALAQADAVPPDLTFLAPVQPADSALNIEVANLPATISNFDVMLRLWPVLAAVVIWLWSCSRTSQWSRSAWGLAGWLMLAWLALRWPNGAPGFFGVVALFLAWKVIWPALRPLWRLPIRPEPQMPAVEPDAASAIVSSFVILLSLGWATSAQAQPMPMALPVSSVIAESVMQQIEIDDQFAVATARIHWRAERGQLLPLLQESAVLTHITLPPRSVTLAPLAAGSHAQQLLAQSSGTFDIEIQYQMPVTKRDTDTGLVLPVPGGLINEVTVTLTNLNVDVVSPSAVSIQRSMTGSNTVATLVLTPGSGAWVGWTPRSRDVKDEKPVFYAEFTQLYAPSPGVIEGAHRVSIRPAQGELGELIFNVPAGATITDVVDPDAGTAASRVALWRFDPDARKLRVTLNPAQSRPFALLIRSQVATGTLPFEQAVGLMSVEGAAGQIGLVGVGTGNEVQLDNVSGEGFSAINLEDFPADMTATLAAQFPDLTVRRAYRYSDRYATAVLKASAVEPDVRVQTQDTLSLGEDRTVLASTLEVTITRAGIFHLSFRLPDGYEVESISGPALSHWTELKTDAGRLITLNLTGKTVGEQSFSITLSGPGIKPTPSWAVPQLALREANKQAGTLLIVPEQGLRLQAAARDGVTQLDPQQSGVRQKGVLAFQVLQTPWQLALDVEQVDPWIQVTSLQQATVVEGQIKVAANLQYQIENTGLKILTVDLPADADGVTFKGDQVADFLAVPGAVTNALQAWEIRLHRRVIGDYRLQVSYQTPLPDQTPDAVLRGVRAAQVNLQRGFVTVQAAGRLQVHVDTTPETLQPAEWQGIPTALQQDLPAMSANFSYRLVDPDFQLPLKIERHEAAKVLPARVNSVTLTSVISDAGMMLTQVRLEMQPGDQRLLHLTLPKGARFWFAFVNQNGVWPWLQSDQILIPLEPPSQGGATVPVEFFFSSEAGQISPRALSLDLFAPKFDLPLEDVTWNVYVNNQWQIQPPAGTLELQAEAPAAGPAAMDLDSYLQNETSRHGEKTKAAEQMLALGNSALENGDPRQARRAFQSAYGLSQDDSAFNEDARVQLNNIKLQQALVGLNVRQSELAGDDDAVGARLRELRNRPDANYTQDDAKEIIDRHDADENAALMRLAGRLIQQQDAAVASPAMIHASLPEQGQLLTFKRSVVVNPWADLNIGLKGTAPATVSANLRVLVLSATALVLLAFGGLTRRLTRPNSI